VEEDKELVAEEDANKEDLVVEERDKDAGAKTKEDLHLVNRDAEASGAKLSSFGHPRS
jgi:hypothetical protein